PRPRGVDRKRLVGRPLRAIDIVEGGGVDDPVGMDPINFGIHGPGVSDIELAMIERVELRPAQRRLEIAAELPAGAGQQDDHLAGEGVRRQPLVVAPVVVPEFGRLPLAPPLLMLAVPLDRLAQPIAEGGRWLPAALSHPGRLQRVPIVMTGTVFDEVSERARLAAEAQHAVGDVDPADLGTGADVVRLARVALPEHARDRLGVIVNIYIVANRLAAAI